MQHDQVSEQNKQEAKPVANGDRTAQAARAQRPTFAFQWHITDECDQRCKHHR